MAKRTWVAIAASCASLGLGCGGASGQGGAIGGGQTTQQVDSTSQAKTTCTGPDPSGNSYCMTPSKCLPPLTLSGCGPLGGCQYDGTGPGAFSTCECLPVLNTTPDVCPPTP